MCNSGSMNSGWETKGCFCHSEFLHCSQEDSAGNVMSSCYVASVRPFEGHVFDFIDTNT